MVPCVETTTSSAARAYGARQNVGGFGEPSSVRQRLAIGTRTSMSFGSESRCSAARRRLAYFGRDHAARGVGHRDDLVLGVRVVAPSPFVGESPQRAFFGRYFGRRLGLADRSVTSPSPLEQPERPIRIMSAAAQAARLLRFAPACAKGREASGGARPCSRGSSRFQVDC